MKQLSWPCLLVILFAAPLRAQLPAARLSTVFPPGGQIGTSVDVMLAGAELEGVAELRFTHPGITAKLANPAEGEKKPEPKFTVSVAADVPTGLYEVRAVGRYGITNGRAFAVGAAKETTRTAPEPLAIEVDAVVNARCAVNAFDVYTFEAKKGQRLLIQCDAAEIDSRLAPVLLLSDAAGREVERDRRDGLIDFAPTDDGRFTLRVHDLLFRGGPEYFYRLSAHTRPHIDSIEPPFGKPETKGTYKLLGRNLPGGTRGEGKSASDGKPLDELSVEIELPAGSDTATAAGNVFAGPSSVTFDGFAYRLKGERGTSNAVPIAFAELPATTEADANDKAAEAQAVSVPVEIAGRFFPRSDRDWFAFDAKKGEPLWIEVTSQRLGHPTAPVLLVQKAGKEPGKFEDVQESPDTDLSLPGGPTAVFRTASRDPAIRFEAKEDGNYRVMVRDLFNTSRDDATLAYRLSIRRAEPDFRLVALPATGGAVKEGKEDASGAPAPFLRKGGVTPARVQAVRRDGFDGPIEVAVEGLPNGVTCSPITLAGGETAGTLLLTTAEDATASISTLRIVGKSKRGDSELVRPAQFGGILWAGAAAAGEGAGISGDILRARLTREFLIAVAGEESAPISIAQAEEKPVEVAAGGKVLIPLKVTKRAELKSAVKLKCAGVAALEKSKEVTIEPAADAGMLELDLSKEKLPPGTYTFFLQGPATVKYTRLPPPSEEKKDDAKPEGDKAKKKPEAKDVQLMAYSRPIVLTVTPAKEEEKPAK